MPSATSECGRGITWTATTVPTRRPAAAPASTAALTAPTSPRTIAVTSPASILSYPTSVTFAALTIASAASIIATNPIHSTIPSACIMRILPLILLCNPSFRHRQIRRACGNFENFLILQPLYKLPKLRFRAQSKNIALNDFIQLQTVDCDFFKRNFFGRFNLSFV